jgi:hypothetical protein
LIFPRAGFPVILRDEGRSVEETLALVERAFELTGPADGTEDLERR